MTCVTLTKQTMILTVYELSYPVYFEGSFDLAVEDRFPQVPHLGLGADVVHHDPTLRSPFCTRPLTVKAFSPHAPFLRHHWEEQIKKTSPEKQESWITGAI